MLLDRIGLAGEKRLVHEEVPRCQQPAVGGHDVSGREPHSIARHELFDGDGALLAVADDLGAKSNRLPQRLDRVLRPQLLDHIEHYAQEDDDCDDDEAGRLSGPCREAGCEQQNQDERIGEAIKDLPPQRPPSPGQGIIGPAFGQAPFRFFARLAP
jgi:hypothetical protein